MSRIPVHDIESAPPGSRDPLTRQSERVGKAINIFGGMANSPTLMDMYDLVETHLSKNSNLDDATRQAIHLTVAAVNDCDYWQAAYTGAARPPASTKPRPSRSARVESMASRSSMPC